MVDCHDRKLSWEIQHPNSLNLGLERIRSNPQKGVVFGTFNIICNQNMSFFWGGGD